MSENWHKMSAMKLGSEIEQGVIDPRELTEFFLERINELDPLNLV